MYYSGYNFFKIMLL